MKGHKMKFKPLKYLCVAVFLVIACVATRTYATEGEEDTTNPNLPYIEMKVNSVKVGETNQILVECWASNFTYLEGIETVFTYDSSKLTPSYISGENKNEELSGLESIKYANRPSTTDAQEAFDKASKSLLVNSFAFDSAYTDVLAVDVFRYMAVEGNNEALQIAITKPDYLTDVSATADTPVLIGTFSFKQTDNTIIEENEFETKRIKIVCDDGLNGDDLSAYMREAANGEDCTEIMEFTYAQYGSISGTIETVYYDKKVATKFGKNVANIKIYKQSDFNNIDLLATGSTYKKDRENIQQIVQGSYNNLCRPDKNADVIIKPLLEVVSDNITGEFKLTNIPYERGEKYIVLIDKMDFADYIITDVDFETYGIDFKLETIQLIMGDMNKDGKINEADKTIGLRLYSSGNTFVEDLGYIPFDFDDSGKITEGNKTRLLRTYSSLNGTEVKQVKKLNEQVEM